MFKKSAALATVFFCSLSVVGCPQRSAVWVEPGSTASHLVIGIGEAEHGRPPANLYGLAVVRCGDESRLPNSAIWSIARVGEGPVPGRVIYGSTPSGFETRVSPQALTPGCYRVQDSGSGRMTIQIDSNGSVQTQ